MYLRRERSAFGFVRFSPLCLGLFAAGCGGGGGSAANPTGPSQTAKIGPVAVTFTGHPQVVVSQSSGTVTSVGQAGASYTTLSINPTHNLNATYLAFTRDLGFVGNEIFTMPLSQGEQQFPLLRSNFNQDPSFTQSGVIAFESYANLTTAIDTVLGDGSQQKTVQAGTQVVYPTISPNGATIAYVTISGNIWTVPSGGGTATEIYSGGAAINTPVVWSPSSAQIAFTVAPVSLNVVETMSSTGTNVTNITPVGYTNDSFIAYSWSPDGTTIACSHQANGTGNTGLSFISATGNGYVGVGNTQPRHLSGFLSGLFSRWHGGRLLSIQRRRSPTRDLLDKCVRDESGVDFGRPVHGRGQRIHCKFGLVAVSERPDIRRGPWHDHCLAGEWIPGDPKRQRVYEPVDFHGDDS